VSPAALNRLFSVLDKLAGNYREDTIDQIRKKGTIKGKKVKPKY
jgi:hypothetical protein